MWLVCDIMEIHSVNWFPFISNFLFGFAILDIPHKCSQQIATKWQTIETNQENCSTIWKTTQRGRTGNNCGKYAIELCFTSMRTAHSVLCLCQVVFSSFIPSKRSTLTCFSFSRTTITTAFFYSNAHTPSTISQPQKNSVYVWEHKQASTKYM